MGKIKNLETFKIIKTEPVDCPTPGIISVSFSYLDANDEPNWNWICVKGFKKETFFETFGKRILDIVNHS